MERNEPAVDTLNKFEHAFQYPVMLGLGFFGLANAGVEMSSMGNATLAVLLALVVGKTAGIFAFSAVGQLIGFPLPEGMNLRSLFVAGIIAALGLTVALFVAGEAYTDAGIMGAGKMGALLSVVAAPLAYFTAKALRVEKLE